MNDRWAFLIASVLLLGAPGPTNALLALAGALNGFRRSIVLLGAQLIAYSFAISGYVFVLGPVVAARPLLLFAVKIAASLFLGRSAVGLWRDSNHSLDTTDSVPFHRIFVATLLNPKALVFAFGILPQDFASLPVARFPYLVVLLGLSALCGALWVAMGAWAARLAARGAARFRRAGAVVLGVFALLLSLSAFRGLVSAPPQL